MAKLFFNHRLFKLVLCAGFSFTFIGCTPSTGSSKTSDLPEQTSTPAQSEVSDISPEQTSTPAQSEVSDISPEQTSTPAQSEVSDIPPEQTSTPAQPVETNSSLLVSQKSSFADQINDKNSMTKYVKTYIVGKNCASENPQYSSCIILINGAIELINNLLTEVDKKAIKAPADYCSESSDLYKQVRDKEIPIGTLRYTGMKNYCNQNGQQFI